MAVTEHQRVEWSAALRSNLEQITDLHSIVEERVERLKALEAALETALKRVEAEQSEESDALRQLSEASEDAVRRARLIGVKLEASFLEGDVKEEIYRAALGAAFPRGPQSLGTTPQQRLEALHRMVTALEEHSGADPEGKLSTLAAGGAEAIEAANDAAKREQQDSREANEALAKARHEFDEGYQATKEIIGGLLRDAGRLSELRDLFPDM